MSIKRDLLKCQKTPTKVSKETYYESTCATYNVQEFVGAPHAMQEFVGAPHPMQEFAGAPHPMRSDCSISPGNAVNAGNAGIAGIAGIAGKGGCRLHALESLRELAAS